MSVVFILLNFIIHKIRSKIEYNELNKLGYINKHSASNYNLNIYRTGNRNS